MADLLATDPRFELLIKLIKLSTSSNDSEALLAIRKANDIVREHFKGDWEALLRGKITIIADPFFSLKEPDFGRRPMHAPVPPRRPNKYDVSDLA